MPRMTPELRAALVEGYESERETWETRYVAACFEKLAAVKDGEELPEVTDLGDVIDAAIDEAPDDPTEPELRLEPGIFVQLGVDYFGLDHLL